MSLSLNRSLNSVTYPKFKSSLISKPKLFFIGSKCNRLFFSQPRLGRHRDWLTRPAPRPHVESTLRWVHVTRLSYNALRRIPLLRLFPSLEMVESSPNSISPTSEKWRCISKSLDHFSDFFGSWTLDTQARGVRGLAPRLGHREHSSRYPGQVRLS